MKIKFLENNVDGIIQIKKATPKKMNYNGIEYTYVGKSKENPAITTQVKAFFECLIMTLGNCLGLSYLFKDFKKTLKNARCELLSGQETVKYYVINPNVSTHNNERSSTMRLATPEELFQKGLKESENVDLD